MSEDTPSARRDFLRTASILSAAAATSGALASCSVERRQTAVATDAETRERGFDRSVLDAVADTVLPESLGRDGIRAATNRFVAWIDGYEPVAEEMHGYGYADVRFLPADPAPAWRAQLAALDLLAQRSKQAPFARLSIAARREVVAAALRSEGGERLPAPLGARHVVTALLAHWTASPDAWNRALGAEVTPLTCRRLDDAVRPPRPLGGGATT
jgi:hypothetical protein